MPGHAAKALEVPRPPAAKSKTVVENNFYRIVFTNRGAQVKSWILKKYKDDDGNPLDLVNKQAAKFGSAAQPLYLRREPAQPDQLGALRGQRRRQHHRSRRAELRIRRAATSRVRKTFQSSATTYVISIETEVTQNGQPVQAYPMWPAALGDEATGPAYAVAKNRVHGRWQGRAARPKKVSSGNTLRGPFNWAGPQDQFFAAIFLPDNPDTAVMVTLHDADHRSQRSQEARPEQRHHYEVLGAAVGDTSGVTRERLFVGPKALNVLESVRSNTAPGTDERSRPARCGGLRLLQHHRPAAVPVAEVDARAHGQQLGRVRSSS